MPVINRPTDEEIRLALIEDYVALWNQLFSPEGWTRNSRGNIGREWNNMKLTVFRRHGRYRWSVAGGEYHGEGPQFSDGDYFTQEDARAAVVEFVTEPYRVY